MERAKSVDSPAVKAELEKFKKEKLLVGPTTFLRGKHATYAEVNCGAERAAMLREQIAAWRAANAFGKTARAP